MPPADEHQGRHDGQVAEDGQGALDPESGVGLLGQKVFALALDALGDGRTLGAACLPLRPAPHHDRHQADEQCPAQPAEAAGVEVGTQGRATHQSQIHGQRSSK